MVGTKATSIEVTIKGTAGAPDTTETQKLDLSALEDKVAKGDWKSFEVSYALDAKTGKEDKSSVVIYSVDKTGAEKYETAKLPAAATNVDVKLDATGNTALNTDTLAERPIDAMDKAIAQIDSIRSGLGAVQNRLESTVTNLNSAVNNLSAANSRIQDADYATEVSNMSKGQILQQAGTAVLAQANQVPQTVLSLLR